MGILDIVGLVIYILVFLMFSGVRKHITKLSIKFAVRDITSALLTFMVTITLMRFVPYFHMDKATTLIPYHVPKRFAAFAVVMMIIWQFVTALLLKKGQFIKRDHQLKIWQRGIMFVLLVLSVVLVAFAIWFRGFFGNLSPEQFLYNLQSPVTGTSDGMSMEIFFTPLFAMFAAMILFGRRLFASMVFRFSKLSNNHFVKLPKFASFGGAFVVLFAAVAFVVYLLRLDSVYRTYTSSSTYIEENYVDIRKQNPVFPDKKRNLVHIYFESVENSYFDKANGGHMDVNLMPDLLALSKEGVSFSNNDKFGGPYQTYGSSWSVAGMVNMMSGIPLKVAMEPNAYGLDGYFLPGIYNLGDLLHDNGYEQTIMFGADADFGGLTTFFTTHGKYNIFDVKHARNVGLIPKDYNVWWGFEDEKLYEYAKSEMTRLANTGKPFHLSFENADTHFPNGYATEKTPKEFKSQYANVIKYSQQELVKLVRWMQQQPWYENTTVIITGDHLSMDKDFFANFDPKYHRTVYNLFLNAPNQAVKTTHRHYAPVDFYPTILSSLGIKWDSERAGLGTNLFSAEQTLIERDGLEMFNGELEKNSNFYNEAFVSVRNAKK